MDLSPLSLPPPRHGRITIKEGRLLSIEPLWVPRRSSLARVWIDARWRPGERDRCRLFYSGTRRMPGFTTVNYVVSGPQTSYATLCCGLEVLDDVARQRQSYAIVAHVGNGRISSRMLRRWGWQPHAAVLGPGHWIKRFYEP